jgi:hypothetical protein
MILLVQVDHTQFLHEICCVADSVLLGGLQVLNS